MLTLGFSSISLQYYYLVFFNLVTFSIEYVHNSLLGAKTYCLILTKGGKGDINILREGKVVCFWGVLTFEGFFFCIGVVNKVALI